MQSSDRSDITTAPHSSLPVLPSSLSQCYSPFWLPILGINVEEKNCHLILAALPETRFLEWLDTTAAESWPMRCRLARDVAVGLYQRPVTGATHIAWDARQLYLDKDGRAQLVPLISETPLTEGDDVYALGQLIYQVASRRIELAKDWQQGKGLPHDCPSAVVTLIQACTDPIVSARPSLKTLAKALDVLWASGSLNLLLIDDQKVSWLSDTDPRYQVGVKIQRLRQRVLTDPCLIQELSCYIALDGQSQAGMGQPSNPLYTWVERELLQGEAQVLLLQGAAGAGKSTFNRHLLRTLWQDPAWQSYRPGDPAPSTLLPIFIPLQSTQVNPNDLWDYYHHLPEIGGFTIAEIQLLQSEYCTLWIADGYDEIPSQSVPNLYDLNHLSDYQGRVKLIIGCRSQRAQVLNEVNSFVPHTNMDAPDWLHYRMRHIAPFTLQQLQNYIEKFVEQHRDDPGHPKDWDVERYKKEFAEIPELQTLINTPLMLWITLSILPGLASEQTQPKEELKMSAEKVVKPSSIVNQQTQSDDFDGSEDSDESDDSDSSDDSRDLPSLFTLGSTGVEITKSEDKKDEKEVKKASLPIIVQPKITRAELYDRFVVTKQISAQSDPEKEKSVHSSFLDYFMTTAIIKGLLLKSSVTHDQTVELLTSAPLTPDQIDFLADRVKNNRALQQALFALIERSKTDASIAIASANAATVLNACQINFSGRDWRRVQLPGANLSYGLLAHTDLRGANLRGATLQHTILYCARLKNADLHGVYWGEQPWLLLTQTVNSIAWHPSQPWLAVSQKNTIELWDNDTGQLIGRPLTGHSSRVSSVAFSPNGCLLASGSDDCTVRLWDVVEQKMIGQPLSGHLSYVTSVRFSHDGRLLASGSWDKTVRLWNVEEQKIAGHPLTGHSTGVKSVVFSPDGRLLASGGSDDRTVYLWDVVEQKIVGHPLTGHSGRVESVAFNFNGRLLASSDSRTVRLWDVLEQKMIGQPLTGHSREVSSITFSSDGRLLASGSLDNTVCLWDVAEWKMLGQPLIKHSSCVCSVSFSPDDQWLASASYDKTVRFWNIVEQKMLGQPFTGHSKKVTSLSFSHDDRLLASGSRDETVYLWEVAEQKPVGRLLTGHSNGVGSMSFSHDNRLLASTGHNNDCLMCLWDVAKQKMISQPLTGHSGWVNSVSFSPNGRLRAFSARAFPSWNHNIRLWDTVKQKPVGQPFVGHGAPVNKILFSADGRRLVSSSDDKTVRLWDVDTQKPVCQPFIRHAGAVTSVSLSPDGLLLASGSSDNTIHLWNVATQTPIFELIGQWGKVNNVSFNSTGLILASSEDNTVRLWKVSTGRCLKVIRWHRPISTVIMTAATDNEDVSSPLRPDEEGLALGDEAGAISIWAVSHKGATVRFVGMPRHPAMPLLVQDVDLQGCRMDSRSKRLLELYGANVRAVVVVDKDITSDEKKQKGLTAPYAQLFSLLKPKTPGSTSSSSSTVSRTASAPSSSSSQFSSSSTSISSTPTIS